MADKLKPNLYVKSGNRVIRLPKDLALLSIALGDLRSVGYKGDLYLDSKLTKSVGNISEFI